MQPPLLNPDEIHVWTATLALCGRALAPYRALLGAEERARADRFLLPGVGERFTVARATLRRLLAMYLDSDPAALRFGYAARGKPYLAHPSGLGFNVSHAGDAAMIAIASQREIGIDIEATTREVDVLGVADRVFSPDEAARLSALAPEVRPGAFFRLWTRKEAYIKARGDGFGYPTRSFSVSHRPDDQDALLADEGEGVVCLHWRITDLVAPDGFHAALAAPGRSWSVSSFDEASIGGPAIPDATIDP